MKHIPVEVLNNSIACSCGEKITDQRLSEYGPIGRMDKLLDIFNEHHKIQTSFECGRCGEDRREHKNLDHEWEPGERRKGGK